MNCKKIKELIITDYLDGEIDLTLKKEIEGHLKVCNQCRQFVQALRQSAVEPFKDAKRNMPPESVWRNIESAIEQQRTKNVFGNIADKIYALFPVRKPAFVVATIITIALIALVIMRPSFDSRNAINAHLNEQIEFLAATNNDYESAYPDMAYTGLGTNIEEYFL